MIYIYTDGSSNGGRGRGGYAWIICTGDDVVMAGYGSHELTTNNLMELEAAIQGLQYLLQYPVVDNDGITLVSDSQYVLGIANGTYTPFKNLESAEKLRMLAIGLSINTMWVRGHNGHQMNEIADSLAKLGRLGQVSTKKHQKKLRKQKWRDSTDVV